MSGGRVLMVTPLWPPRGAIGVRRPVRLARHLPAFGWTPVVLTDDPDGPGFVPPLPRDPTLEAPPVELHRAPGLFPGARARKAAADVLARLVSPRAGQLIRQGTRGLLLPDHYPEWAPAAVRAARRLGPVDVVWTTGMPFGAFVVAAAVARALDRPLVLDYRDPWSLAEDTVSVPVRVPRAAHAALERRLLARAAGVSYVNADMLEKNRAAFGQPSGAVWAAIPNGFDAAELAGVVPRVQARPTLLYSGGCYGSRSLLQVLRALHALGAAAPAFQVFGEVDTAAQRFLAEHPLAGVTVTARVPSAEIRERQAGADALLLVVGPEHRPALTGKLFDYLAAGRPILGCGPTDAAAARLVRDGGLGPWVDAADEAGLAGALRAVAERRVPFAPRPEVWRAYTAEAMAESTAALFDAVSAGRRS